MESIHGFLWRKEKVTYMVHSYYGGVEVTHTFSEKGSIRCLWFSQDNRNDTCLTTTELPAPVVPFSFQNIHTHFPVPSCSRNTNCHTIPDSSIPVDTDYSNRFQLCAEGYTLPTSPVSAISLSRDPNARSLSSPICPNLNGYPEGVRPPVTPRGSTNTPECY